MEVLKQLHLCVNKNTPDEALRQVVQLSRVFEDEISTSSKDLHLLEIFDTTNGLLVFIQQVIRREKAYKTSVSKSLELLITLVNNFPEEIEKYHEDIIKTCKSIVVSLMVSSDEKSKALELLYIVIEKKDMRVEFEGGDDLYNSIYNFMVGFQDKSGSTVQDKLLKLIGLFTRKYPSLIHNFDSLRSSVLFNLEVAIQKQQSTSLIDGLICCLSDCLQNHPYEKNSPELKRLYDCLKLMLEPFSRRKMANRDALDLFKKHVTLLEDLVYPEANWWNTELLKWFDKGAEECKVAYIALEAFYDNLNHKIAENKNEKDKLLLQSLVDYFKSTINDTSIHGYKMRSAIVGLGLFANSYQAHYSNLEVSSVFNMILQRVNSLYILSKETNPKYQEYLPNYIQTLSNIMAEVDLSNSQIESLERLTILMINVFPKLSVIHHKLVVNALHTTFYRLSITKKGLLERFLETIIYQGIVRTCCHQLVLEVQLQENNEYVITYKTFLPLWRGLLNVDFKLNKYYIHNKEKYKIYRRIFDEFIKVLLILITKLNLKTRAKDIDIIATDPGIALEAEQIADVDIFVNVIDLYVDILTDVEDRAFKYWLANYVNHVVRMSLRYPLISGFYKLVAVALRFSNKIDYFKHSDMDRSAEVRTTFETLYRYIQYILIHMKAYKEDLQMSCLQVILNAPVCLLQNLWPEVAPIVKTVFFVGRGYLKLIDLGIDALEKWIQVIPPSDLDVLLREILPILDSYLRSKSVSGGITTDRLLIKKRISKVKASKQRVIVEEDTELFNVQRKILLFVAKLSSEYCLVLAESGNNIEPVVWSKEPHLKVVLPFEDLHLNLYLDKCVPRILEICLYSSDRKTRIVACELLHSIVMIMLGYSKQMSESSKNDLDTLFGKIMNAMLELCCTMDQTIRDMFCPLIKQIVHWYSLSFQVSSSHSEILLDTLFEGACHPFDALIRDTSGACLKEFTQYTRKSMPKNFTCVEKIIEKLQLYSMHPDSCKRLGAALIFNNIYTEIREEENLVNKYGLELLYSFVMNLTYIENHRSDTNGLSQVNNALDHIVRVIVEKQTLFNLSRDDRNIPPNFKGGSLKDTLQWIFSQTSTLNPYCREKCIEIFLKIASKENISIKESDIFAENSEHSIYSTYHHYLQKHLKLQEIPINNVNTEDNMNKVFKWMNSLSCSLDGHIFIFELTQKFNFFEKNYGFDGSNTFKALENFLSWAHVNIKTVLQTTCCSSSEKEHFDYIRSVISSKILKFTKIILESEQCISEQSKTCYFNANLWSFLCNYLFNTVAIGFDLEDLEKQRDNILVIINLFSKRLPQNAYSDFLKTVNRFVEDQLTKPDIEKNVVRMSQRQFIEGIVALKSTDLSNELPFKKLSVVIMKSILKSTTYREGNSTHIVTMNNTMLGYFNMKLDLAFFYMSTLTDLNDIQHVTNMQELTNFLFSTDVISTEKLSVGTYIFNTFKAPITKFLVKHFKNFLTLILMDKLTQQTYNFIADILSEVHKRPKDFVKEDVDRMVESILEKWLQLSGNFIKGVDRELQAFEAFHPCYGEFHVLQGVDLCRKIAQLNSKLAYSLIQEKREFHDWILELMAYSNSNLTMENYTNFLEQLIEILPCIVGPEEVEDSKLRETYQFLKTNFFQQNENYTIGVSLVLNALLDSTSRSSSNLLLTLTSDIYSTLPYQIENVETQDYMKRYMVNLKSELQETSLNSLRNMCFAPTYAPKERLKLAKEILVVLLTYCKYSTFEQFYTKIGKTTLENLEKRNDLKEATIANRTIYYILIEVLFSRINIKNLDEGTCPIMLSIGKDFDKRKFIQTFLNHNLQTIKESIDDVEPLQKQAFRLYQSHSYNAFVSIICNTKKDIEIYTYAFVHMKKWKNIIDVDKQYNFEIDFDEIPRRRKILLNIRSEIRDKIKEFNNAAESASYFESERLFNSTLKEDVCKYDFTNTTVRSQLSGEMDYGSEGAQMAPLEIVLEKLDVNEHICMSTVCGLIKHMVDTNIHVMPGDDEVMELPQWMECLTKILANSSTPTNVRIFLLKVIENMQYVFKGYAKWFIEPIMKVIVDGCGGNCINFYISDLILMILSWYNPSIKTINKQVASSLLEFLMDNVWHEKIDIFKHHLDLLKRFVEAFNASLEIPHENILKKLESNKRVAVHIMAICLKNNLPPWPMGKECQETLKRLLRTLDGKNGSDKAVYQPASETIGIVLNYLKNNPIYQKCLSQYLPRVQTCLEKIDVLDKKICCLDGIAKHYPSIVDKHVGYLLVKLGQIPQGDYKCKVLRTLLAGIDYVMKDPSFTITNFKTLIHNTNANVRILALEIILKSLPVLTSVLFEILDDIKNFIDNKNPVLRNTIYDIFISSYKLHKKADNLQERKILDLCIDTLLQGFGDSELEIENKLLEFWSEQNDLPAGVQTRYLYILENLYRSSTEDYFLGNGMHILLNVLCKSDQFSEKIYDYTLHDCIFQEYTPRSDWRQQHTSMIPLFVSSQKSQYTQSFGSINPNMLLATQKTLQFQPTVASLADEKSAIINEKSSLLISDVLGETFKNPNKMQISDDYKHYRRRFYKDKTKMSREHAFREIKKTKQKEDTRKDAVKKMERTVRLFRTYKDGEFPDIQIPLSGVVVPLQMLAKHDTYIAKYLFQAMFDGIIAKNQNKAKEEFFEKVQNGILNVLRGSTDYSPSVISTFLDIALTHKDHIVFHPNLISKVAEESGLMSVGSLLLEEYIRNDISGETSNKRVYGEDDNEVNLWIKLANLYKAMDEWDVVTAIFLDKMNCKEEVLDAVEAESRGLWDSASHYYHKALEVDYSLSRKDFYYESYFKCTANLSQWDKLAKSIQDTVNTEPATMWNALWDDNWNRRKLLPWYVKAEIRNSGNDADKRRDLLQIFNQFLGDDSKKDNFKSTYMGELAFLWLTQDKLENCRVYLNDYMTIFLDSWSELNPNYCSLRVDKLLEMQNTLDILIFLGEYNKINSENSEIILGNMNKYWEKTSNVSSMSIVLNETRTFYRKEYVDLFKNKILSTLTSVQDEKLDHIQFELHKNLVEYALRSSNFHVSRKYHELMNPGNDEEVFDKKLVCNKLLLLRSKLSEGGVNLSIIKNASKKFDEIRKNPAINSLPNMLRATEHMFTMTAEVSQHLAGKELNIDLRDELRRLCKSTAISTAADAGYFGVVNLNSALQYCEEQLTNDDPNLKQTMADCYLKLSYFVRNDLVRYEREFITFVLKAIYYDSVEARQLFPCLLSCRSIGGDNREMFTEEALKVPLWIYLQWIPQILASLDTFAVGAVSDILLKIANTYPQAIMYPYRLCSEKCTTDENPYTQERNLVFSKIDEIIKRDFALVDELLQGLSCVTTAKNLMEFHLTKLSENITSSNFKQVLKKSIDDLYGNDKFRGDEFKSTNAFKRALSGLEGLTPSVLSTKLTKIYDDLKSLKITVQKLKDCSPWLANFHNYHKEHDIEIPGQYLGDKKPLMQYHAKISSFQPQVQVFASLRKPIKITILGSDAKEYSFLVKFGEDLRQDQRVQQIFNLMNGIFSVDPACGKRQLKLHTYKVVPLCSTLGMIEFVNGTKVLKELLFSNSNDETISKINEYERWMNPKGLPKAGMGYGDANLKHNRDATVSKYNELVYSVDQDLFRKAFWNISVNPESFVSLRQKFATSYAVMCVSSWILGVGDRHLSNTLISLVNGEVISIDFGYAFGAATEIIRVPELVPFRLTPHIVNLMDPLKEYGYYQQSMIHCLRAVKNKQESILATMNVFLQEPSLDWLAFAKRLRKDRSIDNLNWYPEVKMSQARRKLNGANPAFVMQEDVRARVLDKKEVNDLYCEVVLGYAAHNYRARQDAEGLSPDEQVRCLMDQATDPNLLGRMWQGWEPWI